MEVPERPQEPYEAFMIVPEIMEIVIGFGIFQIRLDLTKFSRLESSVTWMEVPERSQEHYEAFMMVSEIM